MARAALSFPPDMSNIYRTFIYNNSFNCSNSFSAFPYSVGNSFAAL